MLQVVAPGSATHILLHSCCAPCSAAIIECLLQNGIRPTVYYYNPNIYPLDEYLRRKDEAMHHVASLGLDFIDGDYDHHGWLCQVRDLEDEPERGRRCLRCFTLRLTAAARQTALMGLTVFTTTLASSRWKRLDQINEAGRAAAASTPGTIFWEQNWRRGGLQERRNALLRQHAFYNQRYCGCEFSLRATE